MLTPQEFSEAYERSYSRTVRFLQSRGVTPDVAEEVAQSAWARGWERLAQLQSKTALLPWVNSIALNALRGYFRQQSRAPQLSEGVEGELPARQPMSLDARHDLQTVLAKCTPEEQQLLWAYWGEGFTSNEIASQMDIKPVSVRVRIGRIAKAIDKVLHVENVRAIVTAEAA